ncbi:hypothetical protein [Streptomyces sp. NPDC059918]|uniref:hypothetical protein n=1 Tax=unclassified Streptomyces TaxID=2593676 RepID=UPI003666A71F
MTYPIADTGHSMTEGLTRREAEEIARTTNVVLHGPNLHTNDGTWYAITESMQ